MGVSKVVYGGDTLIDLTSDTVAADKLLSGYTAHAANGEKVTGTYTPEVETETLLWENADPDTNFNSTTRTFLTPLSENLVPLYKKLKIVHKRTAAGTAVYETEIVLPDSLANYVKDQNKNAFVFGYETSDYYSCRYLQVVSDTRWWVSTGYRSNNTSGISTHNVITHIYGIK